MKLKDFSNSFSPWTCVVFFAVFVCPLAKGRSLLFTSRQPIVAAPGDDVILPCYLAPPFDVVALTVKWSLPDLKPNPSTQYVHLYRNRVEVTDLKLSSYVNRTQLFTDELKHGNISLKIINVILADAGRYRCYIPELNSNMKPAIVDLVVDPSFIKTSTTKTLLDPRNLQTTELVDQTNNKAGGCVRTFLILSIVFSILLFGGASVLFS